MVPLDEVDGFRGSLFGGRETFSLPPDIMFCPSPSSASRILVVTHILDTEYKIMNRNI